MIVGAGSVGAFRCVCLALRGPGDEVVLFQPCHGYHLRTEHAARALTEAGLTIMTPPRSYDVQQADTWRLAGRTRKNGPTHLLRATGVARVPTEAFYESAVGENVRFCFTATDTEPEGACQRRF